MDKRSKWCLIGIPDHQGVMNVGGRVGAAGGPAAFRRQFGRLKGRDGVEAALYDLGDIGPIEAPVERAHRQAAEKIRECHAAGARTVIVGGGHDHGYSQLLGIWESRLGGKKPRLGCINIDAHLDLREPTPHPGSGSPFYLAIEAGVLDPGRLVEFGIQAHCNAPELWKYAATRKVGVVPFEKLRHGKAAGRFRSELRKLARRSDLVVVSLDIDAAAAAFAPGVSAPQADGFSASDVLEMMEIAGSERKVASLGIFELNPEHDRDDRTARLCAVAAYQFLRGAEAGSRAG